MINGQKAILMLTLDAKRMLIIAEIKGGDPKVIEVPRNEAEEFIEMECSGKI